MNLWSLAGGLLCFCLAALPGAHPDDRELRLACGCCALAFGLAYGGAP